MAHIKKLGSTLASAFLLLFFIATTQARYRHPFALDNVRTYFPVDDESSSKLISSNVDSLTFERPRLALQPAEKVAEEIKKNDPIVAPLRELEAASRPDEFGPSNAQLYGDYYNYSIKKKMRKTQALNRLYEEIAAKFPFLVKQGLFESGSPPSLDHLLSMTVFSQPKAGRK